MKFWLRKQACESKSRKDPGATEYVLLVVVVVALVVLFRDRIQQALGGQSRYSPLYYDNIVSPPYSGEGQ